MNLKGARTWMRGRHGRSWLSWCRHQPLSCTLLQLPCLPIAKSRWRILYRMSCYSNIDTTSKGLIHHCWHHGQKNVGKPDRIEAATFHRLTHWNAFLAFFLHDSIDLKLHQFAASLPQAIFLSSHTHLPGFFRSTIRASRVSKPAAFKSGRNSGSNSCKAFEIPWRAACIAREGLIRGLV